MMDRPGHKRTIAAGEILFEAGDESDHVYFVDDGELEVVHRATTGEVVVGTLGPGEVVGEITAVIGGRRTATIRATSGPVTLRELAADAYAAWLEDKPDEGARIAEQARDRIDHTRVARVLTELIGPGHPEVVDDVHALLEWQRLDAGEVLFNQGDAADAAYIILTGRLHLTAVDAKGRPNLDSTIGRGDIVGELGIIEQAPRSATATALRDCTLAKLSEASFEDLTARHPKLMLQVFRKILARVMSPQHRSPHAGMIAVALMSDRLDRSLVRRMAGEIERHGATLHLDRDRVRNFFNRRGVVDATVGTAEHAQLDEFLSEADVAHRWVVLETDPTLTPWTSRALRSADRVLLVTSPFPDDAELHRIREFSAVLDGVAESELWVVQSNAPAIRRPIMNTAVRRAAKPDRILQHERGDAASTARLARLVSGTATGAALSGGGARAFAQIGALCALEEAGHQIDVVSGTSMGSIVAASLADLADPTLVLSQLADGFAGANIIDYTVPLVSLTSGYGLMDALHRMCGNLLIEELSLPFSCLSTNLTTAELVEHRTGLVANALRSSVSLPGVFPPVVVDGELLVDGGVLENLPVGPLVNDPAVERVIAIDVGPPAGPTSTANDCTSVRGSEALFGRASKTAPSYPAITGTVLASMLLSSARARKDAFERDLIDVYLSLNLQGVKLLDFESLHEVSRRGYEATVAQLEEAG